MVREMPDITPFQGELQAQVMSAMWRLREATVDQVRDALAQDSAYTTVQTVLNRLADRGLLAREREGRHFRYVTLVSEAEYVSGSLRRTLAGASVDARQAALAQLIGALGEDERAELAHLADEAAKRRADQ